jgi:excisionase family DNA binding protein
MNELLTPEEAAARLKVKLKTVKDWLRAGRLPGYKIGRAWRLKAVDVDAFIEASRVFPPVPSEEHTP